MLITAREVRLKIGDIEAEAHTPEEVQKLIDQALEIQRPQCLQNHPETVN